jgi:hypothetical protein
MAYAGTNLWTDTRFHAAAGTLLVRLLPGADKERMSAVLGVFRVCDGLIPEPTTLAFLGGLAAPEVDLFGAPSNFIVEKLQSMLPHAADVIGVIALKLVKGMARRLWQYSDCNRICRAPADGPFQYTAPSWRSFARNWCVGVRGTH